MLERFSTYSRVPLIESASVWISSCWFLKLYTANSLLQSVVLLILFRKKNLLGPKHPRVERPIPIGGIWKYGEAFHGIHTVQLIPIPLHVHYKLKIVTWVMISEHAICLILEPLIHSYTYACLHKSAAIIGLVISWLVLNKLAENNFHLFLLNLLMPGHKLALFFFPQGKHSTFSSFS